VSLDVDATTTGPPGQLRVLPRRDVDVPLAVPLAQLLEYDGARRHVDAQGKRLGREHDLDQTAREQLLDDLLERGQHARVVGRDATAERLGEVVVPEHAEVLVR
jgi:hypothetical protein